MKKILTFILVAFFAFALVACGGDNGGSDTPDTPDTPAGDVVLPEGFAGICQGKKVYLTCSGQADLDTVQNLMKKAGLTVAADSTGDVFKDNLLDASTVQNGSVVFLTVGGSNKGITGAGSNSEKETQRASILAAKAEVGDITLIVCHVGGSARRGTLSDGFIKAAAPSANLVLVTSAGNSDGYFSGLSNPVVIAEKSADLLPLFKGLFGIK